MIHMRRSETHYTIVIINLLIVSLTVVIAFRRVLNWISLTKLTHLQIGWREILFQSVHEISAFIMVLIFGLVGTWAEARRKSLAVWINIGVPVVMLGLLGVEYLLHGSDHPEENATALFLVVLPIGILFLVYCFLYFREYLANARRKQPRRDT